MRVAVCDDLKESLKETENLLRELDYVSEYKLYHNLDTFLEAVSAGERYDVVLMDICWKSSQTGIDAVERLSEKTKVIFVTAYPLTYVESVYGKEFTPSGFLMKPVKRESFQAQMDKVYRQLAQGKQALCVSIHSKSVQIPYLDICYLESQLHKVDINLCSGKKYTVTSSMREMKTRLTQEFVAIHQSYVVNLAHVREIGKRECVMASGKTLPLSKTYASSAKTAFMNFLRREA